MRASPAKVALIALVFWTLSECAAYRDDDDEETTLRLWSRANASEFPFPVDDVVTCEYMESGTVGPFQLEVNTSAGISTDWEPWNSAETETYGLGPGRGDADEGEEGSGTSPAPPTLVSRAPQRAWWRIPSNVTAHAYRCHANKTLGGQTTTNVSSPWVSLDSEGILDLRQTETSLTSVTVNCSLRQESNASLEGEYQVSLLLTDGCWPWPPPPGREITDPDRLTDEASTDKGSLEVTWDPSTAGAAGRVVCQATRNVSRAVSEEDEEEEDVGGGAAAVMAVERGLVVPPPDVFTTRSEPGYGLRLDWHMSGVVNNSYLEILDNQCLLARICAAEWMRNETEFPPGAQVVVTPGRNVTVPRGDYDVDSGDGSSVNVTWATDTGHSIVVTYVRRGLWWNISVFLHLEEPSPWPFPWPLLLVYRYAPANRSLWTAEELNLDLCGPSGWVVTGTYNASSGHWTGNASRAFSARGVPTPPASAWNQYAQSPCYTNFSAPCCWLSRPLLISEGGAGLEDWILRLLGGSLVVALCVSGFFSGRWLTRKFGGNGVSGSDSGGQKTHRGRDRSGGRRPGGRRTFWSRPHDYHLGSTVDPGEGAALRGPATLLGVSSPPPGSGGGEAESGL